MSPTDGSVGVGETGVIVKRVSPSKRWSFCFNGYNLIEMDQLVHDIKTYCKVGFFSKEIGETGNEHLQGYIEFKTRRRPSSVMNKRIHFEKSKGNREDNLTYCLKQNDLEFSLGIPRQPRIYSYVDLYPEQREIVDWLNTKPDERTIGVCVAGYGKGKTSLARHIVGLMGGLILTTTRRHSLAVVLQNQDKHIMIFDLTADESEEPPSDFFELLESLKNGLFCSGFMKHTGPCLIDHPHILIFSNYNPLGWNTLMDKERFKIFNL